MFARIFLVLLSLLLGLTYPFLFEPVEQVRICMHQGECRNWHFGCNSQITAFAIAQRQFGMTCPDEIANCVDARKKLYWMLPPRLEATCILGEPFWISSKELSIKASAVSLAYRSRGCVSDSEERIFNVFKPGTPRTLYFSREYPN